MNRFDSTNAPTNPTITVVTVVYNLIQNERKEAFRRCVESVSSQDYPAIEHLIIDGASTDGTLEWIRECGQNNRNLRVVSEPDSGIYDAMNKGIRLAKGEFLAFLNSDDFYHDPRGLRVSLSLLEEHRADFSYSPIRVLDASGNPIPHPHHTPTVEWTFVEMTFSHQSMLFRKETLLEFGGYKTRYKSASDYDLILRHILSGKKAIEVPFAFASFSLGGLSQVQMTKAQHETGEIFADVYSKACGVPITPQEGLSLYLEKKLSPRLQTTLLPALASCFYASSSIPKEALLAPPKLTVLFLAQSSESLASRIASLQRQTLSEFEVIALAELSETDTWNTVKTWQKNDPRVKLLPLGTGLCTAMNCGINGARGKILYFYFEGDPLPPNALEKCIENAHATPSKDSLRSTQKFHSLTQFHHVLIQKQSLKPQIETLLFFLLVFCRFPLLFSRFVFHFQKTKDPKTAYERLFFNEMSRSKWVSIREDDIE